jgi:hypothetical protein
MGAFEDFFLARKSNSVRVDLLEITHPSFSKVYRIVRNVVTGVTVNLPAPDNEVGAVFDFYPVKLERAGLDGSMDSTINLTFGDLTDIIPEEIARVRAADTFSIAPKVRYWVYRSDDYTQALLGPLNFEITALPYTREGFAAAAQAPTININGTGEVYALERFPMLRGFL